jgi:hypothetical protein
MLDPRVVEVRPDGMGAVERRERQSLALERAKFHPARIESSGNLCLGEALKTTALIATYNRTRSDRNRVSDCS